MKRFGLRATSQVARSGFGLSKYGRFLFRLPKPLPLTLAMLLFDLYPWHQESAHYDMAGWTLLCDTGAIGNDVYKTASNSPGLACGTGAQVATGVMGSDLTFPVSRRWIAFGKNVFSSGNWRMGLEQQWTRPAPGTAPLPWVPARTLPGPIQPVYQPWADPMQIPVFQPVPTPEPPPFHIIPERRPNPWRDPKEQPTRGPSPQRRVRPDRTPRFRENEVPGWEWRFEPGKPTNPQGVPKPHVRMRPRRDTEKKTVMAINSASKLGKLLGLITESVDFIEAAFNSLEYEVQRGNWNKKPQEKLWLLLTNLDKIRPGSLLANLFAEQLEDKAFGKLGKIGAKAAQSSHREGYGHARPELGQAGRPKAPSTGVDEYVAAFDEWLADNVYRPLLGNP